MKKMERCGYRSPSAGTSGLKIRHYIILRIYYLGVELQWGKNASNNGLLKNQSEQTQNIQEL